MHIALISALKDIMLALVMKIGWKVVAERFASRVVVSMLRYIASLTTNDLTQETVSDILEQLGQKRLPKIAEAAKKEDPG